MKVLHLIPSFGSGGAERQLSIIAPCHAASGLETHIGYCQGGPNLSPLTTSNAHLHILPKRGNYDPALLYRIVTLTRKIRPDIVHTWLLQMDILGAMAGLLIGLPLILSERSSGPAYSSDWKTRLRLLLGQHATYVVANSQGGMDYWRPHIGSNRLRLVRNCVSPVEPTSAVPLPVPPGVQVVLFAGRFSYEKNIPALVQALILVARQHSKAAIIMFGEGPERESAAKQIAAAGLDRRILVAGYTPQLAAWMVRAAVCVSVSHFEGHPNVVIEAAAAGCPLVVSDIPAHRELFDERSAALVPPDSPAHIAEAVLGALYNPSIARERAAHARAIAMQYNLPAMAAAYRSIYEDAVATARSSQSPSSLL